MTVAPSIALRPYQTAALHTVDASFQAGKRALLVVLPTGAGKTILFAELARRTQGRVLVLVHRRELAVQAMVKIEAVTGILPGLEMGQSCATADDRIVVASVQTLSGASRNLAGKPFELVVIDEAHHAGARSYKQVLDRLAPKKIVGVTATPQRNGKTGELADVFQEVAYSRTLLDLIDAGFLCDVKIKALPIPVDLDAVRISNGDFQEGDLGEALAPVLDPVAAIIAREHANAKLIAFCPLRTTSKAFASALRRHGLPAAHVDGQSSDRESILGDFHDGRIRFLSNAMLLTEGYDEPSIDTVLLLRPTKSSVLLSQMIGRGTRLHSGKAHLTVIDPMFQTERHDIARVPDLVAGDAAKRVGELMREGNLGLREAVAAETKEAKELQAQMAERLRADAKELGAYTHRDSYVRPIRELRPFEASLGEIVRLTGDESLMMLASAKDGRPASAKQIEYLRSLGVAHAEMFTAVAAAKTLTALVDRRNRGLASLKQAQVLWRYGFGAVAPLTKERASEIIAASIRRRAA